MSCYETVVLYRTDEEEKTKYPKTGEFKENMSAMYMEDVCSNDNRQETLAICSILEAALFRVSDEIS